MRVKVPLAAVSIIMTALFVGAQKKPTIRTIQSVSNGTEMTIVVTPVPRGEKEEIVAAKLQGSDFAVYENKVRQRILNVRPAGDVPTTIAIVIQDNLNWRVNNEIKGLREFISKLPAGTRVMTAYLGLGGAIVMQEPTTDRKQAADSLRVIRSSSFPLTFSPFDGVADAAGHFNQTNERRLMIVISDGLDMSRGFGGASPTMSIGLDRAISECQRRGVAVYTIYAPVGERRYGRFDLNYGQGSLIRLADETGGESYFTSIEFINFAPYLEEFIETSRRQWIITYRSSSLGTKFRKVAVTTDFDIHLHHTAGYKPASQNRVP